MRRGSPRRIGTGRRLPCLAAAVVAGLALAPALAQERGQASATGSDSLTLNGQAYRLFGIDGLAFDQSCFVDGQPFACGVSATRALQTLLATSAVSARPKGRGGRCAPVPPAASPSTS